MAKFKLGLALGSGGWRGLAHIGVIKSLLKHGFSISAIAGSSAGALIGGLYASLQDIEAVESLSARLNYKDLLFAFADPSTKLGLFQGTNTLKLIQKFIGKVNIETLPIPFAAVASDIFSGQAVTLTQGDLAAAIRASSSVPLIYEPVNIDHQLLIDGGAANPVPVAAARSLGADIVIAVDIYKSMFKNTIPHQKLSKIDVINLSYHLLLSKLAEHDAQFADLVIEPDIQNLALDPFSKFINNQATINLGETAMDQKISELNNLITA